MIIFFSFHLRAPEKRSVVFAPIKCCVFCVLCIKSQPHDCFAYLRGPCLVEHIVSARRIKVKQMNRYLLHASAPPVNTISGSFLLRTEFGSGCQGTRRARGTVVGRQVSRLYWHRAKCTLEINRQETPMSPDNSFFVRAIGFAFIHAILIRSLTRHQREPYYILGRLESNIFHAATPPTHDGSQGA